MSWANRTGESRRILAEAKGHKFLHRLSMGQRFRQSPEKPKWGLKKLRKFTTADARIKLKRLYPCIQL